MFKKILNTIPRPLLIRFSIIGRPVLAFILRGNKFTDPIDGKSYRKFLPYGKEEGTELIRLLHFAPEQAFYKRFRNLKTINYTTTDLNSPIADVKADICNLPFADNSFDLIICNHVLEHIPDDTKAMQELYRVLAPNGTAILQVPYKASLEITLEDDSITDRKERARIFGQYDHVRIYGMDYFEKLQNIGFEVYAFDYTSTLTSAEIERYRLPKGELIPIVKKLIDQ